MFENLHFTKNQALCSWFERPISNNSAAKAINFSVDLKNQICYFRFHLLFAGVVKSSVFFCAVDAIPKRLYHLSHVFASNGNSSISTLWNSISSVQKALDLTTPEKNWRKLRIIDLNFQMNKQIGFACRAVWNWPSKSTTQSLIFHEM